MDANGSAILELLAKNGPFACVLAWFMFKIIPQLEAIQAAINRLTHMQAMYMIKMNALTSEEKNQVQEVIDDIAAGKKK